MAKARHITFRVLACLIALVFIGAGVLAFATAEPSRAWGVSTFLTGALFAVYGVSGWTPKYYRADVFRTGASKPEDADREAAGDSKL